MSILLEWVENGGGGPANGMQKSLKNYKARQNSLYIFLNKGGSGWCKRWFVENCEASVCVDHDNILADFPGIFFQCLLQEAPGLLGTSLEQCLCLISTVSVVQLNMALTFPDHSKPNR